MVESGSWEQERRRRCRKASPISDIASTRCSLAQMREEAVHRHLGDGQALCEHERAVSLAITSDPRSSSDWSLACGQASVNLHPTP
jgi:hypothetical protein